ncbi:MAG: fibronectin type III domain-containing protein [Patescibacteria group bacterium]
MQKSKLRSVSAIIIGTLVAVPLLIFGFMTFQSVLTRASGAIPENVRSLNVTDKTAVISWTTGQDVQGVVEYGTKPEQLVLFAPEAVPVSNHRVTISLLEPGTTYYYVIRIGTERFDNDGVPWSFKTKADGASSVDGSEETGTEPPPPGGATGGAGRGGSGGSSNTPSTCPEENDCEVIRSYFGKGCSTADYLKCLRKQQ